MARRLNGITLPDTQSAAQKPFLNLLSLTTPNKVLLSKLSLCGQSEKCYSKQTTQRSTNPRKDSSFLNLPLPLCAQEGVTADFECTFHLGNAVPFTSEIKCVVGGTVYRSQCVSRLDYVLTHLMDQKSYPPERTHFVCVCLCATPR